MPQPITPNLNPVSGQGTPGARRADDDARAAARRAFFELALQGPSTAASASAPVQVTAASPIREPVLRRPVEDKPSEPEKPRPYARPGSYLDIRV